MSLSNSAKKFTIYHNPRCNKSRETLDRLKKAGVEPRVVEYLKYPMSADDIDRLLKQLKLEPHDLTRKTENRYTDLELATSPPRSRREWVRLLAANPVLIERPIVSDGVRAVLGRPPENVDRLLAGRGAVSLK